MAAQPALAPWHDRLGWWFWSAQIGAFKQEQQWPIPVVKYGFFFKQPQSMGQTRRQRRIFAAAPRLKEFQSPKEGIGSFRQKRQPQAWRV